jgi:hypothetical protein
MRRPPPRIREVLDAKRSVRRARIEERAALVRACHRAGGNGWCDDDLRRRCRPHDYGIQPRIDDSGRKISRLMAERRRVRVNPHALTSALMLVAGGLGRRRRVVVMARHDARQLAGGGHHRWSNQDQHQQHRDDARQHRIHRSTHESRPAKGGHYSATRRRRSAFAMTDTELNVIAALAIIGLSSKPNTGYNTPAATGTPSTL